MYDVQLIVEGNYFGDIKMPNILQVNDKFQTMLIRNRNDEDLFGYSIIFKVVKSIIKYNDDMSEIDYIEISVVSSI